MSLDLQKYVRPESREEGEEAFLLAQEVVAKKGLEPVGFIISKWIAALFELENGHMYNFLPVEIDEKLEGIICFGKRK